jgi:hypothetical protein
VHLFVQQWRLLWAGEGARAVSSGGQLAARAGKGVKRGQLWRVLRLWRIAGVSWRDRRHRGGLVQRGTRRGAAVGLLRFHPCRVRGRKTVQSS